MRNTLRRPALLALALGSTLGCGTGRSPTGPTPVTPTPFIAGNWNGSVTLQTVDATTGDTVAAGAGDMSCAFTAAAVDPGVFRVTCRLAHPWLTTTSQEAAGSMQHATPPTPLQFRADYMSPRGCLGSFLLSPTASSDRLEGPIRGIDCGYTFSGQVNLQKR